MSDPDSGTVYPINADVTSYDGCKALIDSSMNRLGSIDVWINNAGVSVRNKLVDLEKNEIDSIIDTNLRATVYCCNLLIPVLDDTGIIINVEGAGSNGFETPDYGVYGATKSGVTQFTKTLQKENPSPIICTLSPGIVITDLLLSNCTRQMKTAFNIFGEKPDVVAEFLTNEIYKIKSNTSIRYLTLARMVFLMLVYVFDRHRHFDKNGKLKN